MNEALDRAARAAFWNWRQMPKVTEGEMIAVWNTMPDAAKEPWCRTARMVIEAIAEPTKEMYLAGSRAILDDAPTRECQIDYLGLAWREMVKELLK